MLLLVVSYYIYKEREMLCLQYFYNKSHVVSYYWFKFEINTKIIFLPQQQQLVTTRHLGYVVKML